MVFYLKYYLLELHSLNGHQIQGVDASIPCQIVMSALNICPKNQKVLKEAKYKLIAQLKGIVGSLQKQGLLQETKPLYQGVN